MREGDPRIKGMTFNKKAGEYILQLEQQLDEARQNLEICHSIIKGGCNSLEQVAYVFDISESQEQDK